jgi:hypothetical protein
MNTTWNWSYDTTFTKTISTTYNTTSGVISSYFINSSQYSRLYYWHVNVSDGHGNYAQEWFCFTTEAQGGAGGGSYMVYSGIGIVGVIGIIGILGFLRRKRRKD